MQDLRIIGAEAVAAVGFDVLIAALARAHAEAPPEIARQRLSPPDGVDARTGEGFLVLPAWAYGRAYGVKMATVRPQNAARGDGLPTVQAVYQLFDGDSGRPRAVIDGTALTLRKTAADSGLGSRLLSRREARTLLMVGAGALAPHLIAAHRIARPGIEEVLIWNRTSAKARALAGELAQAGILAGATGDLEAAARQADVICTATMAATPLIRGDWLKPGAHLDLVGAYTPEMRECDDAAVRRAEVFVDYRGSTIGEVGDLVQPMRAGVIAEADVQADLFELCQGQHPGRTAAEQITLYKNGGGGHLDLFVAEALMAALR